MKICRSVPAAASRFATMFPVDGEYLIKVRLRRQYQDYLMGMGWPQQLDVRLDGKLVKRFIVGGKAPGTPAASSYAGDGEPGFAGAPEWETYMQLTGDAGLEVRVPVIGGPARRRRVVRARVVGTGRPPAAAAARPRADQRSDLHGLRGGRRRRDRRTVPRGRCGVEYAQPPPDLRLRTEGGPPTRRVRAESSRGWRVWPIAAPVTPADRQTLLEFFESGRRDGGTFDAGIQFALERMLVDPDFLLRVHRRTRGDHRARATSNWPHACRSSSGAAFPTSRCSMRPSAASCRSRRCSNSRSAACWPIRAPSARSSTTSPPSG